ncbi:hypothetical protein SEEGA711_20798 [Salmonella enterica subsp. enterica serovar Gaminara str. ATCC BAA-711]|nr:hypothetical protein SEEGA711_20798 [Salmonella enterica subsp. enterica serovar Gaminara str. ATCC BAA-711]
MDVKGTGALTDMPDNVMSIWRNIPRELAMRKAKARDMRVWIKTNRLL